MADLGVQEAALLEEGSVISVSPLIIEERILAGSSVTRTLLISNSGDGALDWAISTVERSAGGFGRQTGQAVILEAPGSLPRPEGAGVVGRQPRPAGQITIHRPSRVVGQAPDVLLVHSDDDNYYGSPLQGFLQAYGDLGAVDLYEARYSTPSLGQLQQYDVVVTWSQWPYADADALGDVLADYVDQRGRVIVLVGALPGGWEAIEGRFLSGNYSPVAGAHYSSVMSCLGTYDEQHPILAGVTDVCDRYRMFGSYLTPESTAVAYWQDGEIFAGVKNSLPVVGIAAYVGYYYAWTGQMADVLHNSIWFLMTPTWLAAQPVAGTVPADASMPVTITLDASGLVDGTYSADIVIDSSDPVTPQLTVPVTLHVGGEPAAVITPTVLDFGQVFVGYSDTRQFLVENQGTADLVVLDVVTNDPALAVTPSNFTVPSIGSGQVVTVTYAPLVSQTLAATLLISSNDPVTPVWTIDVTGLALQPPVISVAPGSIKESLVAGDTVTRTLVVSNDGGSDLNWEITVRYEPLPEAAAGGTGHIGILGGDDNGLVLANIAQYLVDSGRFASVTTMDGASLTPTLAELQAFDALAVFGWSPWLDPVAVGDTLADYVDAGGNVLIALAANAPENGGPGITGRFSTEDYWLIKPHPFQGGLAYALGAVFQPTHPVMSGVTSVVSHSKLTTGAALHPGASLLAAFADGTPLAAADLRSCSRRVDVSFPLMTTAVEAWGVDPESDAPLLITNALAWLAIPPCLRVNPDSGVVPASSSAEVALTVGATDLITGTYRADLSVLSNDPLRPEVTVPVTVHVAGEPMALIMPTHLDYGEVYAGYTHTTRLIVGNSGRADLLVSDVSPSDPALAASPSTFVVPAFGSQAVEVAYTPPVPGVFAGSLAITSNDPVTPVSTVEVVATPVYTPAVGANPSIFDVTQGIGLVTTHTLLILNAGLGTLEFELDAVNDVVSVSPISGTLSGPGEVGIDVVFDSTELAPGTYYDQIAALTNDPATPLLSIPVTLTVILLLPETPANPNPQDGEMNVRMDKVLAWAASPLATTYDVYLWPAGDSKPITPTASGLAGPTYDPPGNLPTGTTFHWQANAVNESGESPGPEWTFTVEALPDLEVTSISGPPNAWAGQPMELSWVVTNQGNRGTTVSIWYDRVYISLSPTWDPGTATSLGQVKNPAYLGPGQSYLQTATFSLPQGIFGDYYVYVVSDIHGYMRESDEGNNTGRSATPINVQVPPVPDLQLVAVGGPANAFSGEPISVTWTVRNEGEGATQVTSWSDRVYLAPTTTLELDEAFVMCTVVHTELLKPDETYTASAVVNLPQAIYGTYYLFVTSDILNQVYEYVWEENNTGGPSDPVQVTLSPPPDLEITILNVPPEADAATIVTVDWQVTNSGPGSPFETSWQDRIYLSPTPILTPTEALVLGTVQYSGVLPPGESYARSQDVILPQGLSGIHYIHVWTDYAGQVFEFVYEENNVASRPISITLRPPDLVVSSLLVPDNAGSGQEIAVVWDVTNQGAGPTFETSWHDCVFLYTEPVLDPDDAEELAAFNHVGRLEPGAAYSQDEEMALPNGISGVHYLHVWTDCKNNVFEHTAGDNNVSTMPISVTLTPSPDLLVTQVSPDPQGTAGTLLAVGWSVANAGPGPAAAPWQDRVYLSVDPLLSTDTDLALGTFQQLYSLALGESYTQSHSVVLPEQLAAGIYYVLVQTDFGNVAYEHNAEGNNVGSSSAVAIAARPPTDLLLDRVTAPASGSSGQPIAISWIVTNTGSIGTQTTSWTDAAYLSTDADLDTEDDILLDVWVHSGALAAGQSYTTSTSPVLPDGIEGEYYLFVLVDSQSKVDDDNRENNCVHATPPISVTLSPWPDLVPAPLNPPAEGLSGQPLAIEWAVNNPGEGGATGIWHDAIYLSADPHPGAEDVLLASVPHNGGLPAGAEYAASKAVSIPNNATGQYYVVLKTDSQAMVYEHTAEDNNLAAWPITITMPPPADLVVASVEVPSQATPGQPFSVGWTVENQGDFLASGHMCDALYISADQEWSIEDAHVGDDCRTIYVEPGEARHQQMSASMPDDAVLAQLLGDLPGVTPGQYYAIIRADILNNIPESNEDNNAGASLDTISVDVEELTLGVPVSSTLAEGESRFYRVDVSAGQTVLLTLDSQSTSAANELYVRYESAPSRSRYDYGFTAPFEADQEVVVPTTISGTYFILLYGASVPGALQSYSLEANEMVFELRGIDISEGGQGGRVTLRLDGLDMKPSLEVRLSNDVHAEEAGDVYWIDAAEAYATFDLSDAPLGAYDVEARQVEGYVLFQDDYENPVEVVTQTVHSILPGVFTVVSPDPAEPEVRALVPGALRPGQYFEFSLVVENPSRNDITSPLLALYGVPDVQTSLPGETSLSYGARLILAASSEGPAGVIRPGASVIIRVGAMSPSTPGLLQIEAHQVENTDTAFSLDDALRSIGVAPDSEDWKDEVAQLSAEVGGSWIGYQEVLAHTATQLSQKGFLVRDADRLLLSVLQDAAEGVQMPSNAPPASLSGEDHSHGFTQLQLLGHSPMGSKWAPAQDCDPLTLEIQHRALESVAALFQVAIDAPTGSSLLLHYINGDGSPIDFGPGGLVPMEVREHWTAQTSYDEIHEAVADRVHAEIEAQVRATGGSLPRLPDILLDDAEIGRPNFYDFGLPGEIPAFPPGSDLVTSFGGCNEPSDAQVKFIKVTKEASPTCEGGVVAAYRAVIEYHFNDLYTFDLDDNNLGGPDSWAHNLQQCGWATPFHTSITMQEETTGKIILEPESGCEPPGTPERPYDIPVVRPVDPNDIVGLAGYGDARWVPGDGTLGYTIHFENDPKLATAPAQRVEIYQTLDSALDPRTFRLGSFGLGDRTFEVAGNTSLYSQRLGPLTITSTVPTTHTYDVYVDATAAVNVLTNEVFWIFQSIDPDTGAPPADPLVGFLPPNVVGNEGQGFATYVIRPKAMVQTGDVVTAAATIFFDNQGPLTTPPYVNTLDAGTPVSSMSPLPPQTVGTDLVLTWAGGDDEGGSGVRDVDIYLSTDNSPFGLWQSGVPLTATVFSDSPGHMYGFFALAHDHAGNREAMKTAAEATTTLFLMGEPARIALTAAPSLLEADGSSTSSITATVFDGRDGLLSGQTVAFTTTLGTLSALSATTDVSGTAVVTLTSNITPGLALLTATAEAVLGPVVAMTTVRLEQAIAGLTATNDGPTQLGEATALTATVTAGSNVTYEWAFGDQQTGSGSAVTHMFPEPGRYTAIVTASNAISLITATTTVTVTDAPVAGVVASSDSPTSLGSATTLTATVTAGTNVNYNWRFGDGGLDSGAVVTHTYEAAGIYTAVVTASNSVSAITATTGITVTQPPIPPGSVVIGGPSIGSPGVSYLFTASVSPISATVPITWFWQATGHDPITHTADVTDTASFAWSELGPQLLVVTAENAGGYATGTHSVNIVAPLHAAFTAKPTAGEAPLLVQFTDESTGTIKFWQWLFGDGDTSIEQHPAHKYMVAGAYTVTLTVEGAGGSDTMTRTNFIQVTAPTLHVQAIYMQYWKLEKRCLVLGLVRIVDRGNLPQGSARVVVRWNLPDGSYYSREALTGSSGWAPLWIVTSQSGLHEICVSDVLKSGWVYDPLQNVEKCDWIDVKLPSIASRPR